MCGNVYFWRQVFILATGLCYSISVGFMITFPSVLTPALLSPNSTDIQATSNQASWIAASNGLSGIFGFFILSPILQKFGRKAANICCNIPHLIGWIMFPFANSISILFAARIIQGIAIGGVYITSMITCEYVYSERRGHFTTITKISLAIGTLACHAMSLVWSWRQISAFAILLSALGILLTFFWPESPFYLAMKGRFEECEESFIWLNGRSNLPELHHLRSTQMERMKHQKPETIYKNVLRREFMKPFIVVSLLTVLLDFCGRYFFVVYVIQIMVELIGDKSIAIYCTLGADCLTIFALASSFLVIGRYKRRYILFSFGSLSCFLMILISIIISLKSFDIGTNLVWLTPLIIILQNFIVNLGLTPVSFAIIGEIFPLEYKGVGSCVSGIVFTFLYSLTLKLTPILIDSTGVGGTYAVYGIITAISLILLYLFVPETKDKTLQEIEDEIKGIKAVNCEVETNSLL